MCKLSTSNIRNPQVRKKRFEKVRFFCWQFRGYWLYTKYYNSDTLKYFKNWLRSGTLLTWQITCSNTIFSDLGRLPCQCTKSCTRFTDSRLCYSTPHSNQILSADSTDVCILIWGSLSLGEEPFQNHTLASLPNTSPYRDVHGEQWGRRCFLPLNLDLTIQTKHLQSLTVETEKQWNIGNGFVFKVRHTQKHRGL